MNEAQKNAIREADNYLKAAGLTPYSELRSQFEEVIRAMKEQPQADQPAKEQR